MCSLVGFSVRNNLLTLLLSLSQVEKPLLSLYWSPKNQVSLSPIVFTIYTHDKDSTTRSHVYPQRRRRQSLTETYLIKELFASGAGQDGKLQLSIHGCHSNIYLSEKNTCDETEEDTFCPVSPEEIW